MQICLIIFLLHNSAFHILLFYSLDFHCLVLTDFTLIGFYDSPCRFIFYLQPGTLPSERLSPSKKTVLLDFFTGITVAPSGSDQNTQRLLCYMNTFLSSERFQAALQWAARRGKEEQRGEKEVFSLLLTSFLVCNLGFSLTLVHKEKFEKESNPGDLIRRMNLCFWEWIRIIQCYLFAVNNTLFSQAWNFVAHSLTDFRVCPTGQAVQSGQKLRSISLLGKCLLFSFHFQVYLKEFEQHVSCVIPLCPPCSHLISSTSQSLFEHHSLPGCTWASFIP